MNFPKCLVVLGLAVTTAFSVPFAASAQSSAPTDSGAGTMATPAAPSFSEDDVETYAHLKSQAETIGAEWSQKMAQAQDLQQQNELRRQAEEQMVQVIEDEGFSVQKYNQMYMAEQHDPELRQAVQEMQAN